MNEITLLFSLVLKLGGTVGDIESMPFVEAFRQFQFRVGRDNFCVIHVSLIPLVSLLLQSVKLYVDRFS